MSNSPPTDAWQDQHEMFQVDSPCIGVCTSGARGYCRGCLRSRMERFHWHEMSDNQKVTVVRLCQSRKARITAARLKRSAETTSQQALFPQTEPQIELF